MTTDAKANERLPELLADIEQSARWARAAADRGDPLQALADMRRVGRLLGQAVRTAAYDAHEDGASWQRIGDQLHVTKQAAQQRFGAKAPAAQQGESLLDVLAAYEAD